MRSSSFIFFSCLALMATTMVGATEFKVGGSNGWSVLPPTAEPFDQWTQRNRFLIGDSLLFVYPPGKDSVLLVEKASYEACNTTAYIAKYDGGATVFTFDRSGPFYFVSAVEANCRNKESLAIVVLADRTKRAPVPISTPSSASPPPPSPGTSSSTPPPPPSSSSSEGGSVPSSTAAGGGGEASPPNQPPTPSENGAAARVAGSVGAVGVIVSSVLLGW